MSTYRPLEQQYYKHQDGGLYFVLKIGKSTVDQSEHVVYVHVFPFEMEVWIRPLEEWTHKRFTILDHVETTKMLKQNREATILEISASKSLRRLAEGKV